MTGHVAKQLAGLFMDQQLLEQIFSLHTVTVILSAYGCKAEAYPAA